MMGDGPVYLSFDIDAIDPGFCPGTGTPEIGGLTTIQVIPRSLGLAGAEDGDSAVSSYRHWRW